MENKVQIPELNTDDKITKKDIKKRTFTITGDNKSHFPNESCNIEVVISGRTYRCSLISNSEKDNSYLLNIGAEAMQSLALTVGDCVSVKKPVRAYIMSKIETE